MRFTLPHSKDQLITLSTFTLSLILLTISFIRDLRYEKLYPDDLRNRIVARRPQIMQDEAGLMFVTVPVRSTTERQLTIEYRATFFDRNREVIQETTWFPKTLPPFTQETLTLNSTSPRADDFQFDIRPAK